MAKVDHGYQATPEQFREWGRLSAADCASLYDPASDIHRQLRQAADRRAAASAARSAAVSPPPANRGGKSSDGSGGDETVKLVLEDGKVKEVPKRRGYGGSAAVVDWVNFTVGVETFDSDDAGVVSDDTVVDESEKLVPITLEDYIYCASRRLKAIFGYGISHKLPYGQHFYQQTWAMGEGWGNVSIGGQRGTLLVSISGTGLAAAKEGWELRLKTFLEQAERARITRIDLAHDDYGGKTYCVDRADRDHTDGLFNCGGRNPSCEHRGDWKNPNGKGRSFYVGNRKNGKYCRVYEKGRELGSPTSEWVRVEVEFKSVDRVIPFDALILPGEYLAAAYPAFAWITEHQERIETTQKVATAGVDRAVETVKHQFGNYIHSLVQLLGVEEFVERCSRNDKEPAFMKVPHFSFAEKAIHEIAKLNPSAIQYAASSAW